MKVKRLLSCVTFLIGVLPCVASCQSTGSSSSIDTVSSATHTHVFAEGTYPCQDRVCLTCGKTIKATEPHSLKLEKVVEPTCTEAGYVFEGVELSLNNYWTAYDGMKLYFASSSSSDKTALLEGVVHFDQNA